MKFTSSLKEENHVVDMLFLELIPPEIDSLEILH